MFYFLQEKTAEFKCPSEPIRSRGHALSMTYCDGNLDYLTEAVLARFLPSAVLSDSIHWKQVTTCSPCEGRKVKLHILQRGGSIYVNCLGFFHERNLSLLSHVSFYLFIHLLTSVWIYRYLFYTLGYNPILQLFVLLPKLFQC